MTLEMEHVEVLDDFTAFRFLVNYMAGWSIATSEQESLDRMLKSFMNHNIDLSYDQVRVINTVRRGLTK